MEKTQAAQADASLLPGEGRGAPGLQSPPAAGPDGEEGRYRFSLDVSGFAVEELSAQLDGRRLTVRARHARQAEAAEGGGVLHRYREVRRRLLLPDDADLEALACSLEGGGRLCVEVPRLPPAAARPGTVPVADRAAARPAGPEDAP